MNNSYAFAQSLGQYDYDDYTGVPPLHDLMYVSRGAYAGSMDRYQREECQLPISKFEFLKYFDSEPDHKISVFITSTFPSFYSTYGPPNISFLAELITKVGDNDYILKHYYSSYSVAGLLSVGENRTIYDKPSYDKYGIIEMIFKRLSSHQDLKTMIYTEYDPFTDPHYEISFDIVTLYEMLTSRGQCVKLVKDYAKNIVLTIFDEHVNKYLSNENFIPTLNLYLYCNASVLGINKGYEKLLRSYMPSMYGEPIENYLNDTAKERNDLIERIREEIVNF